MAVTFSPEVLTKARNAGFQDHEIQAVLAGDERIKKALDSGFTLDEVAAVWPKPEPQPLSDIAARIPAGIAKASADALVGISRATAAVEPYLPIVGNLQRALGQGDYREKQQKAREEMAQLGESAASVYGVKEEYNQTLPSKIISAAGSVVPALASGSLAPLTIAGMMGEQQRQEAEAEGGTEKQKNIAFATGAGLGALSEALMGVPALLRSAKAVGIGAETFKDMAKDAAKQAIKAAAREGVQEGVEQIGQNIIAAKIAGYDPNRKVMAGVKEAAIIGAIVGAPVGAAVQVAETADQVRANTQEVTKEVNQTLTEVAQAEPPTFTKLSDIPPTGEPNATVKTGEQQISDQQQYPGTDAERQAAEASNRDQYARSGEIPPEAQVEPTAEPTTARTGTEPTPPPASTPTEGAVVGEGPASAQTTESLSAAQLNERIDVLLGKRASTDDPALKSQYFKEAQGLMEQLKAAEEQSMGPGAAAATETLAQYAERKFGIRFEEDPNLSPELKQAAGNRFYEVLPNKVTAQEASDIIDRVGDDAAERLIRDETNDTSFATRSTVGQILIRKLNQQYTQLKESNPEEASRVLNRAADLAEWQMDYGTRLGQGVQTFAMWMQLNSEGKLLTIKKAVRKARERHRQKNETEVDEILDTLKSDLSKEQKVKAINRLGRTNTTARKVRKKAEQLADKPQTVETFYDIASKELGLPELTGEQELKLRELGSSVDAAEEGLPKWLAADEFMKYSQNIKGFTAGDFALGYFYGNILSGLGTQAVNTVDTLLNVIHEVNTLSVANPKAAAKIYEGLVRGLETGKADAVLAITKGRRISSGQIGESTGIMESAFGTKGGVPINETGTVSKTVKKILESKPAAVFRAWKYIGRAMSASDAVMFRGAQEARAGLLAYQIATEEGLTSSQRAKRVNEILGWDRFDDFLAKAKAEGFQGQEAAARATELMIQQRPEGLNTDASTFAASSTYNDKPKGAFGYAARTAAAIGQKWPAFRLVVPFTNIVANVFNRRLDNLPGVALYRAKRGYYETPEEAKNAIIRANVSLGLLLGVIGAAAAGKIEITGSGPDDPERKKQLKETGWRPYSIKIGNQYWSYANTPISLGLGITGNMMDWQRYKPTTKKDDDNFAESAIYAVSSIFSYLLSQNFISGLSNFFNILSGSEGERKFALKRFLGSNAAAAAPLSGALKDIDSAFDDTMRVNKHLDEAIIAQIPFVRFAGKPALNAFGEPVTTGRIRPLTRFVNQERTDPAWKVIADKGLRVPVPDPFFKTDEENYQYQKESGLLTKQWVLDNEDRLRAMATPDAQEYMNESTQRIRKGIRGRMIMESIK